MVHVSGEFEDVTEQSMDFAVWADRLPMDLGDKERATLAHAWAMAERAYAGHDRESGEGYLNHAVAVANIVGGLRLDTDTLVASLLHDLPWFEGFDATTLARTFGDDVAALVDGTARMAVVSGLHRTPGDASSGDRAEALRKMLLAMARDIRVVFIVLAERLHDMRMLKFRIEPVQQAVARETLDLYAPLANRLGIWQLKWEMEDLCFRYLEPETYKRIARLLAEKRVDREHYIHDVRERLSGALREAGIDAEVTGRPKHIYSIWRKMQRKGLGFHELFDIRAFRVLVDTVPQCYAALGVAHALWQPIPREFDDYIATPKENDYRSLHTAVVGPRGKNVEIQIRTRDMHQQAELGIAAHWRYKEGRGRDPSFDDKVAWLRRLLEGGGDDGEEDLIDRFRAEVFEDRVYVLTPRGDVIDLPRGATPLDFAYHVHTQVGHRCRGAKINGRMVPLTCELRNGDQVEVLTARNAQPSRDWLNPSLGYLRTPRALAKARSWFRQQDFDKNAAEGRTILDRELHRLGLAEVNLERLAGRSRFPRVEEFLAAIGRGDITGGQIASLLSDLLLPSRETEAPREVPVSRPGRREGQPSDDVTIYGVGNLLTRLARCCRPTPGEPIIGFITQGQGVTIHRRGCPNVQRYEETASDRLIEVSWTHRGERRYPVDIQIEAYDRQGLIRDITALLNNEHINVTAVNTRTDPTDQRARMTLTLEVADAGQLSRVMERISGLRNVRDVRRVASN
ncbi:MAG TPA: GTP diphosphokinase [Gammaproteobacteria bacterium]|nr:GTP diphosphokinase [Gammaproteobacteria bacterium]